MQATTQLDEMIESCMPLVRHYARSLTIGSLAAMEDLVSEGYVGLVQAAKAFDPSRGIKFSTFAVPRIRGAMLDALRREHPLSRPMAKQVTDYDAATATLTARLDRQPTDEEAAEYLETTVGQVHQIRRMRSLKLVSLDQNWEAGSERQIDAPTEDEGPEEIVAKRLDGLELRALVARLMPRDREIVERIFWQRQSVRHVAAAFGVSESRVSQIQHRALANLKRMLEDQERLDAAA